MQVYGHTIPEEALQAGRAVMQRRVLFRFSDVSAAMHAKCSCRLMRSSGAIDRAADRLLQQERKAGRIRFAKGLWELVEVQQ